MCLSSVLLCSFHSSLSLIRSFVRSLYIFHIPGFLSLNLFLLTCSLVLSLLLFFCVIFLNLTCHFDRVLCVSISKLVTHNVLSDSIQFNLFYNKIHSIWCTTTTDIMLYVCVCMYVWLRVCTRMKKNIFLADSHSLCLRYMMYYCLYV